MTKLRPGVPATPRTLRMWCWRRKCRRPSSNANMTASETPSRSTSISSCARHGVRPRPAPIRSSTIFVAVVDAEGTLLTKNIFKTQPDLDGQWAPTRRTSAISCSSWRGQASGRLSALDRLPAHARGARIQSHPETAAATTAAPPMTSLLAELSAIAGAAFAAEGIAPELGQVQVSDRPDLAEFQCNGALAAAKATKANPRAIAEKIAARLRESPLIGEAVIAGPGLSISSSRAAALENAAAVARTRAGRALPASGRASASSSISAAPTSPSRCMSATCAPPSSATALQRLFRANGWTVIERRASGRLGPADGPAHLRARRAAARPALFRSGVPSPYPNEVAGHRWTIWRSSIRRPPPPAKPTRTRLEAARAGDGRAAGRPARAIARCGSISTMSPPSG